MRNMLRAGALALALLPSVAFGQSSVLPYYFNAGGVKTPVGTSNPLPVSASVSASISGFPTIQTTGTPISVTTGGVTGTLPAGAVVVASNVGTTNAAYCKLGASATTSDQYIAPSGGWFAFTVGANTQLTCITSTSTTTVNMVGGSGLPTGTGGGSGGGGGGGAITIASSAVASGAYSSGSIASGAFASGSIGSGAVASGAYASGSIASGAMVDLGSQADAACGTDNGTCSAIALIKRGNQTATTTATAVQGAIPAGTASIGQVGADPSSGKATPTFAFLALPATTTTQIVALSGSKITYVTSIMVWAPGTVNVTLKYGTGSNCGTGTTTLAGPYSMTAQSGFSMGSGTGPVLIVPSGQALCVTTDATVTNGGVQLTHQQI